MSVLQGARIMGAPGSAREGVPSNAAPSLDGTKLAALLGLPRAGRAPLRQHQARGDNLLA